ncbi:host attachment family protein [Hyphobacterium sp. HN65]|uniref:Host attachment family protein n=1 Tax=Hyphobacterium lacteum TaxID=3116575 RepID=A0ABU7LQC1_9PROT|nr:host attachment family protein [Hyphobacterium sp. HN65]MEE2525789.1 host attachment family protein [Hyphobacterium sp. HN65]
MMGHGPQKTLWVAVMDGAKALIYRNAGDAEYPVLKLVEAFKHEGEASHDIGSDRPGRMADQAKHRSALDEGDPHGEAEAAFLAGAMEALNAAAKKGDFDRLLIYASKPALGVIRPHFSAELGERLLDSIALDITHEPVDQIEKRVHAALS